MRGQERKWVQLWLIRFRFIAAVPWGEEGNKLETATEAVATLRREVGLAKIIGQRRGVGQWLIILFIPYWVHPAESCIFF